MAVAIVAESLYANGPVAAFDPATGESSAIENIVINNLPEGFNPAEDYEIYDVKGVRMSDNLDDLVPGVYIIRQNEKVSKIRR